MFSLQVLGSFEILRLIVCTQCMSTNHVAAQSINQSISRVYLSVIEVNVALLLIGDTTTMDITDLKHRSARRTGSYLHLGSNWKYIFRSINSHRD